MLYRILRPIIRLGIRFYYAPLSYEGKKTLKGKGPAIVVANHPNTLMDAWIVGVSFKSPVYFMAKATYFDTPIRRRILKALKMVPINRAGEGAVKGTSNVQTFQACYRLLGEKGHLLIFPEGTSLPERVLRPTKTGAARIALEAERTNDYSLGVKIIPVGINYEDPYRFRSQILVRVGEPIELSEYCERYKVEPKPTVSELTDEIRGRLLQQLVTTQDQRRDLLLGKLQRFYTSRHRPKKELNMRIAQLAEMSHQLDKAYEETPHLLDELDRELDIYLKKEEKVRKWGFPTPKEENLNWKARIPSTILGLPISLYGLLHNIIPFKLCGVVTDRITDEIEYHPAIATLMGLIFYPLNYTAFLIVFALTFKLHWAWDLLYLVSMPLSGLLAFLYFSSQGAMWRSLRARFIPEKKTRIDEWLNRERQDVARVVQEIKNL